MIKLESIPVKFGLERQILTEDLASKEFVIPGNYSSLILSVNGVDFFRTEEVGEGLLVDYHGDDLIGIEILDVSEKLPKEELKSITSLERVDYPKVVAHRISK